MNMKQRKLIKQMSDRELKHQLILSQIIFFLLSIFLSFFFFDHPFDWFIYLKIDVLKVIYYGLIPGFIIVLINLCLYKFLPRHLFDDGGINEKVFRNQSVGSIFLIALVVAISEEFLFRGFVQTTFGYIFASILFIVVHFRYLKKIVLLLSIIFVSFYIGYLFEVTNSLFVTITVHFVVDFLLGLAIKFEKRGG